ncbi:MaoC family dehydratase N-terminal domain-containing protein [Chloroflexota bacterium]
MAVSGVYSKEEEEMLAEWRVRADELVGWLGDTPDNFRTYPVMHRVATKDLILHMAYAADYWNPLWRDENYARNTRWGGIIAPPVFQHCIAHRGGLNYGLKVPPELGTYSLDFAGDYWDFFKPIYVNDSFRVWINRVIIEDVTKEWDEMGRRQFRFTAPVSYINQRDEVTAIVYEHRIATITPPGMKKPAPKFTTEYVYTKEEIAAIDSIADAEEIRGAKPLYWEDVKVGEEPKPIVSGPITVWDQAVEMQGYGIAYLPLREVRRRTPRMIVVDPVTNIPHKGIEFHLSERAAQILGSYSTTINYPTIEHFLARLITSWMGDDGFLKNLYCLKLSNTPLGDTIFGRGKVTKKYISEEGEHLVDLDVWFESIRGFIPDAATATVSLPSKEEIFI